MNYSVACVTCLRPIGDPVHDSHADESADRYHR
jgi:hypothetical protein